MLCVGGLAVFSISGRSEIIPERTRFVAFPTRLADWQGRVSSLDLATEQFLKVDDYILADYSKPGGSPVNLYVAYYASQRKNESPHSPIVCLPGGGWLITSLERRNLGKSGDDYPYNRVIIQNGESRDLVYYWFDERGRPVADEYWAKWYLLADSHREKPNRRGVDTADHSYWRRRNRRECRRTSAIVHESRAAALDRIPAVQCSAPIQRRRSADT